MARRKHPFHWDVYSPLYDKLQALGESDDPRMDAEVKSHLRQALDNVYRAWELQTALERAAGGRA